MGVYTWSSHLLQLLLVHHYSNSRFSLLLVSLFQNFGITGWDIPLLKIWHIYKDCHAKHLLAFTVYLQAKQHRASFPLRSNRANKAFELLHVDIWGPYRFSTYDGYKLFLSIVDDYNRATWIFLMTNKSSAFHLLESFIAFVDTQFCADY